MKRANRMQRPGSERCLLQLARKVASMVFLGWVIFLPACEKTDSPLPLLPVEMLPTPAPPGSGMPELVSGPDGRVYLTWLRNLGNGEHALEFAFWHRGRWSAPARIASGKNWFVNWADFPSLTVLDDGTLAAHWLQKNGTDPYAYEVKIAFSADGGSNWTPPMTPHTDGTATEHGFVSLLPWENHTLLAFWLDGRKFARSHTQEMTLRFARLQPDGRLLSEGVLDERTCECCQTAAIRLGEEAWVVYRDRSEREIRDIALIRFSRQGRSAPVLVHQDGWEIHGCPVNGPAISTNGRQVAVAWFTAAQDSPRVQLSFFHFTAQRFQPPVQVNQGPALGRVDVAVLPNGQALVLWMERENHTALIQSRLVAADGRMSPVRTIARTKASRASGFPRVALARNEALLAWTSLEENKQVQVARLSLP